MNEEIPIINDLDTSLWGLILQADLVVRLVMLVLLILNINISRGISSQMREDTDSSAFYITLFIIYIAYIAWGTYEVFEVSCVDKLHDTLLWKTSFITIITTWSVISIHITKFIF